MSFFKLPQFYFLTRLSAYGEKHTCFPNHKGEINMNKFKNKMWAQRDGRPAKYRWRPLYNAAKFD